MSGQATYIGYIVDFTTHDYIQSRTDGGNIIHAGSG